MWTIIAYVFGAMLVIDGVRDTAGRGWMGTVLMLVAAAFTFPMTFDALRRLSHWDITTRARLIVIAVLVMLYGLPPAITAARAIYGSAREHNQDNKRP